MTRHELQAELINRMIDDMDLETMAAILNDYLSESYDCYSDEELIGEAKDFYPDLAKN